jgi:S1-C subfamily serine protease
MTVGRTVGLAGLVLLLMALVWVAVAEAGGKDKTIHIYSSEDHADKGYLGVKMQELDDDLREGLDLNVKSGVLINEVIEGSPAAEAGIEDGDVIIEFNGEKVDSPETLKELVADIESGETVKVKVFRDNRVKSYDVTIGDWPEDQTWSVLAPEHMRWFDKGKDMVFTSFGRGRLGVHVSELNEDLAPYFDAEEGEGVLVTRVVDESTAEEMGIKAGDVITSVGEDEVGSKDELIDAVQDIEPGESFEVTVIRQKKTMKLDGEMQENAATAYVRALKAYPRTIKMPHFEKHHFEFSDDEMEALKKELEELREELEEMKKELKRVERKAR